MDYSDEGKFEFPLSEKQFLEEIYVLLRDYFEGELNLEDTGIIYKMPNGFKYLITVNRLK